MMSKIFIDTNIFIYALDNNDKVKKKAGREILTKVVDSFSGVISTQVIQEFYVSAVKKLKLNPLDVKNLLSYFNNFEIVNVDFDVINEAVDISILNKISFWDSLIISSAQRSKCGFLWTEDLNYNQIIRGIKIVNPFTKSIS